MIEKIPLWALSFLTIFILFIAVEIGFRVGLQQRAKHPEGDDTGSTGTMVQSTLALLAFLLAFTFGLANDRFNERRILMLDDANSIRTTYMRSEFLPEPAMKEVQELLRQYVTYRHRSMADEDFIQFGRAETIRIQDRVWAIAVEHGKTDLNSDIGALFIQAVNEMQDMQSRRVAAGVYSRIPETVWYALFFLIFLGMASVGYESGFTKARHTLNATVLIVSITIVVMMIADLDRPTEGFLSSNFGPMEDLAKRIGTPKTPHLIPLPKK